MKQFLGDDFLLHGELAKKLYRDHAAKMPIFDFHCQHTISISVVLEN